MKYSNKNPFEEKIKFESNIEYSDDQISEFRSNKICPECLKGSIESNGTDDSSWIYLYKCKSCESKFGYTYPEMGGIFQALRKIAQ